MDEAWYNPADWVRGAADWTARKTGYHTSGDMGRNMLKARAQGFAQGVRKAPDQLSTGELTSAAGRRLANVAGKKMASAGEKVSGAMHQGAKALRKGMEDNPAGIAAAGIGAGLGALGLSKLLRRRRGAPV